MYVNCLKCGRNYDDAEQWKICPHGPLWAAHGAYCPLCDLVDCTQHKKVTGELISEEKQPLVNELNQKFLVVEISDDYCPACTHDHCICKK